LSQKFKKKFMCTFLCTFNRKAFFLYYVFAAKCLQHARDDITPCNIVLRQIANTWFTRYWRSRYTGWEKLLIWLLICAKNTEYSYRLEFISKLLILIYPGVCRRKAIVAKGFTSDFCANFCQSRPLATEYPNLLPHFLSSFYYTFF